MMRISNIAISIDVVNTNSPDDDQIAKGLAFDQLPRGDGEEWELVSDTYTPTNITHHLTWRLKPESASIQPL